MSFLGNYKKEQCTGTGKQSNEEINIWENINKNQIHEI